MKKILMTLLIIMLFFVSACKQEQRVAKKTNIILIIADDLGYNELGCYGQEIIKTPNIDKMAQEGMRFTDFYAGSPVCAPSRCVLITGLHTGHAYIRGNYELGGYTDETEGGQLPLLPETPNIAKFLKDHGYVTGIIGKWGLGGAGTTGIPNKQGFDYFYGYLCQKQAHDYYPTHLWEKGCRDTLQNEHYIPHEQMQGDPDNPTSYERYSGKDYSQDKMMEKTMAFLSENHDTSFFLYLPFTVPHLALQIPEDDPGLKYYKEVITIDSTYHGDRGYLPRMYPKATYAAMITRMDREIGKIMQKLKDYGIDENTIVLFSSDNGATYGRLGGSDTEFFESNKPLRSFKGSVYDQLLCFWNGCSIWQKRFVFYNFFRFIPGLIKINDAI